MRYSLAHILPAVFATSVFSHQVPIRSEVHEVAQVPNLWFENVALRSNGDLVLNTMGDGRVFSFDPTKPSIKPQSIAKIDGVNALFGIAEVGNDVFAVLSGNFTDRPQNNTMNLSLLNLQNGKSRVHTVFEKSKFGPVNGITALPNHKHIILGADSIRGEILRIDTSSGHIRVAIQDEQLSATENSPFGAGVNGIKIFKDYLYFTNTARQTFGRVKIDKLGNKVGEVEIIYKVEKGSTSAPDDFVMDKHGNAYVAFWNDELVKVTPEGEVSVLVKGLLAGPTSVVISQDEKRLYVATAGQGNDKVTGGQIVEVKL
ncbi:hypothetical protein FHETE_7044 [Fusarium heterosporum]|uniref:SMP-30/Gluconolactonase/LRE-like region domain-containing protein n=1 Tax=Fusarium heterosporum TaxID=42747 RepID=A0A8H5T7G1_FUSHE|nr:hypothetical protein FHETE_7044 [Fusarium heterosporum]